MNGQHHPPDAGGANRDRRPFGYRFDGGSKGLGARILSRVVGCIPGMYVHTPRRNVIVALVYLVVLMLLTAVVTRVGGLVPL